MTIDLFALAAEFAKAAALGATLDAFLAEWVIKHPEFAPDVDRIRALLASETEREKVIALVAGSLAGALHAILAGRGEPGHHSAHMA